MEEVVKDTFPGLFWGYLVVWGLLALYILWMGARLRKLERDAEKTDSSSSEPQRHKT